MKHLLMKKKYLSSKKAGMRIDQQEAFFIRMVAKNVSEQKFGLQTFTIKTY